MKKIVLVLLFCLQLFASEMLHVDEFTVSVYGKTSKSPVLLNASLIFEGRDVDINDFRIIDGLNVIIGSFYAEDLLTSKGKEVLKKSLTEYLQKTYAIDIDNIYIQKLFIDEQTTAQKIIEAIKKEGICK
ncbi:MAG: flagellar basal body-associated FliL family protein [Sulfurospirillum sp.]|nr:flagellar basal body-associated FliL family protein [Sulfurospirillum sp.]